ncbi:MAG: toprim domain-containing protein [Candidatus Woesearchaeota archaeon]
MKFSYSDALLQARTYNIELLLKSFITADSRIKNSSLPFWKQELLAQSTSWKKHNAFVNEPLKKVGDPISFVMQAQEVPVIEAVKYVLRQQGYDAEIVFNPPIDQSPYEVLVHAQKFFLSHQEEAIAYFSNKRRTSADVVQQWGVGFAKRNNELVNELFEEFSSQTIAASGIIGTQARSVDEMSASNSYCSLVDRVTFPIKDLQGRIIGFSGRLVSESTKRPKYKNSSSQVANQPTIFSRSNSFFGLYEAKQRIQETGVVYVTEGYTDVMSASTTLPNVVAALGTGITSSQLKTLSELAKTVVFVMDGDAAGRLSARKYASIALEYGINPEVVLLPIQENKKDQEDIDSLVRKGTPASQIVDAFSVPIGELFLEDIINPSHIDLLPIVKEVIANSSQATSSHPIIDSLYQVSGLPPVSEELIEQLLAKQASPFQQAAARYVSAMFSTSSKKAITYFEDLPCTHEFFPEELRSAYCALQEAYMNGVISSVVPLHKQEPDHPDLFAPEEISSSITSLQQTMNEPSVPLYLRQELARPAKRNVSKEHIFINEFIEFFTREKMYSRLQQADSTFTKEIFDTYVS